MVGSELKQQHFVTREAEILAAALALLNREDWQAATVARIAVEAGIGKGTVYKHFASKEAIYAALSMAFFERLLARLRGIDAHLPPLEWLRVAIRAAFDHYLSHSDHRHVVMFCARPAFRNRLGMAQRERFAQIDREFNALFTAVLARGVVDGLFPDRPVLQLGFPLEAAFTGAMHMIWEGCVDEAASAAQGDCAVDAGQHACGDAAIAVAAGGEPPHGELSRSQRERLAPLLTQLEAFMLAGLIHQQALME